MLDTFQNFAEVGIAVAGFSGIVSAVSARALNARERDHLIALLQTSGLVVGFALIPQVLTAILYDEHSLWLVSSLLYFAVHFVHYGITGSKMIRAVHSGGRDAIRLQDVISLGCVATLLLIGQVGSVAFGDAAQMRFVYLLVLLWHTGVAIAMFGSLLIRAVSERHADRHSDRQRSQEADQERV